MFGIYSSPHVGRMRHVIGRTPGVHTLIFAAHTHSLHVNKKWGVSTDGQIMKNKDFTEPKNLFTVRLFLPEDARICYHFPMCSSYIKAIK